MLLGEESGNSHILQTRTTPKLNLRTGQTGPGPIGNPQTMTATEDGARSRRDAFAVLFHEHADHYSLRRQAVTDASSAFTSAGGELSSASGGAYLPSGQSLTSWLSDQKEHSPHWFTPAVAEPAPVVTKRKVQVAKGATATEKLAAANGDAPARL